MSTTALTEWEARKLRYEADKAALAEAEVAVTAAISALVKQAADVERSRVAIANAERLLGA
jgi:hypothetical protein